jgi:glycosyltransferase involved in cell wall biosynthesis
MPAISIIVPIYNVEKYLHRCLDSVLAQIFTDYECILVDDGSPDNCSAICDEYVWKDTRFRVIHKKQNEGLPKARKSGLDIAVSEFIMHLDSDDWLEPNALALLYKKQQETDADIVMGGYRHIYSNRIIDYPIPQISLGKEPLIYLFETKTRYLWGKIYRTTLFSDYEVPVFNYGEDTAVNVQLFYKLSYKNIQTIDNIIYNYNRCTIGMTKPKKMQYLSFFNFPNSMSMQWIEDFLKKIEKYDGDIKWTFITYMLDNRIYIYLRYVKNIKRQDVRYLYDTYYRNFPYKNKLKKRSNILIMTYHFSVIFGRIMSSIINRLKNVTD